MSGGWVYSASSLATDVNVFLPRRSTFSNLLLNKLPYSAAMNGSAQEWELKDGRSIPGYSNVTGDRCGGVGS